MFRGEISREAGLVIMVLEIESKYACWSLLVHILRVHSPDLVIREPESVLFYFEPLRESICSRTVIHDLAH
jgi:hypothetical protein